MEEHRGKIEGEFPTVLFANPFRSVDYFDRHPAYQKSWLGHRRSSFAPRTFCSFGRRSSTCTSTMVGGNKDHQRVLANPGFFDPRNSNDSFGYLGRICQMGISGTSGTFLRRLEKINGGVNTTILKPKISELCTSRKALTRSSTLHG